MTTQRKLLERFLNKPNDFTFNEMKKLLRGFGYHELRAGKTSGSRIAFVHEESRHIIRLHRPHPQKVMKKYQLDLVEDELRNKGILK